jgi:uncharacterized protein (TIGR03084 family)
MFPQVNDFRQESEALYALMKPLEASAFERPTQFKQWSFDDIIGHLHLWNRAADLSLADEAAFQEFMNGLFAFLAQGSMRQFERNRLGALRGPELLETWHDFILEMSSRFAGADPTARVKWAGPDMSVRSSITARLMETWAHGQAVYDALGVERVDEDRIKNIAVLGVNTFGWTFANRNLAVPENPPYVRLLAPSGAIWEWNEPSETNCLSGSATGFCQTVTQTRNVADTDVQAVGDVARRWMSLAQCFAGPPEEPPAPGERFVQ